MYLGIRTCAFVCSGLCLSATCAPDRLSRRSDVDRRDRERIQCKRERKREKREKNRTEMRREEENVIKHGCDSDRRRRIRDVVIKTLRLERQDNTEEELRWYSIVRHTNEWLIERSSLIPVHINRTAKVWTKIKSNIFPACLLSDDQCTNIDESNVRTDQRISKPWEII